jgi:hypothetical protein
VVPSNRIAPVTAHSIATINQLAPGRTPTCGMTSNAIALNSSGLGRTKGVIRPQKLAVKDQRVCVAQIRAADRNLLRNEPIFLANRLKKLVVKVHDESSALPLGWARKYMAC